MSNVIGVDLGTTNTVVASFVAGKPEVILNSEGARTTPSVVAFSPSGEALVGQAALRQAATNPLRTFRSVKRHMGSDWHVDVDGRRFDAVDLSSMILAKVKADAESRLGGAVDQAVIAVPARFNDAQRTATRLAGERAGLDVLRLVSEPSAAAFAYHLDRRSSSTVVVFDLGGGTFDVSVLRISGGVFEVKATAGDVRLGGDDFDVRLAALLSSLAKDAGCDDEALAEPIVSARILEAAEQAKIELSSLADTSVNLPFIGTGASGDPVHLDVSVSRSAFEDACSELVLGLRGPFTRALSDAGLSVGEVDDIVMVGGASQIPAVASLVGKLSGGKRLFRGSNPAEAVATGAALNAGVIRGEVKDVLLLEATPLSLGIETRGGSTHRIIDRNSTMPVRKSETFTTASDGQSMVEIHVVQGERPLAEDNVTLGRFTLSGISPAPRGVPQIDVMFDVDADGILHVSALDRRSGSSESLTISSSDRQVAEPEKLVREAEERSQEDEATASELRLRLQAEKQAHQVHKTLRAFGSDIDPKVYAIVADSLNSLRSALSSGGNVGRSMMKLREDSVLLSNAILAIEDRAAARQNK